MSNIVIVHEYRTRNRQYSIVLYVSNQQQVDNTVTRAIAVKAKSRTIHSSRQQYTIL